MSGSSGKQWNVINAAAVVLVLVVGTGLLLVGLSSSRNRGSWQMKSTTQVRGIVQGMVTYASSRKGRMPGVNSKGYIIEDTVKWTGLSGHGATVEGRFWMMLDANYFTGTYTASPAENKTFWRGTGPVSSDNYSYAMLELDGVAGEKLGAGRGDGWKQSLIPQAVVLSDRNTGSDASANIQSIHTSSPGSWRGAVGRGDGSAAFENSHLQDTQYGKTGTLHIDDNLFEADGGDDAYMIYEGD